MPRGAPDPVDLPVEVWVTDVVLEFCRLRDANGLLRTARRFGVTNDRLAFWTGIDAAEISKRISGRQLGPVQSLERWQRIADGLGLPDEARITIGLAPNIPSPARATKTVGTGSGMGDRRQLGSSFYSWELVRENTDFNDVVALSRKVLGGEAGFQPASGAPLTEGDIAPLRRRIQARLDSLELCRSQKIDCHDGTLVGYIFTYPLKSSVTARMLTGEITSAAQIPDSQIASTAAREESLYVAMVLGVDSVARAVVMQRCIDRVTRWSAAHPVGHVFGKGSTSDGRRWLRASGFVPIHDPQAIWRRDPDAPVYRRRSLSSD